MFRSQGFLFVFVIAMLAIGFASGCSDDLTSDDPEGRVRVLLTDAPFPFDLVDEANVTIERVELRGTPGTFVLTDDPQQEDLLMLQNGVTVSLGEVDVPEGVYHELRLQVSEDAEVVMNDNSVYDLKVPSGTETGIKIKLDSLDIHDGDLAIVTVDFNVEESFVVRGNPNTPAGINGFIFKPVLKALSVDVQ